MSELVDERGRTKGALAGNAVARSLSSVRGISFSLPSTSLALLALAFCASVAFANIRHTGSLSFPIDDGYIYSNYVLAASQGHFFNYNTGIASGGITSLGWYLLCTLTYWLLAPFHDLLGGLPPAVVQGDVEAARQAGHLYLAAYIPGVICLAATAVGVYRLALLCVPLSKKNGSARSAFCWLLGAVTGANLGLVWGAMSGLEIALSTAIIVWATVQLIVEVRRGVLKWSLLLVALVPLVRPDLLAMSGAAFVWLLWRALRGPYPEGGRSSAYRNAATYLLAMAAGTGLMALTYYVGWGRPFSSSFYAKVRGLRLGDKFWFASDRLRADRGNGPVVAAGLAAGGGLVQWLAPPRREDNQATGGEPERREYSSAALLLLLMAAFYVPSIMLTLSWFGQEERYLMPVYPVVTVLIGLLVWRGLQYLPLDFLFGRALVRRVGAGAAALALLLVVYVWATQHYVVHVRNIRDAHVVPAEWIAQNTPARSIIAAEPIGAVKLFSHRQTFDIVGLTSPPSLGTFRDWPQAWEIIRQSGASYLYFYRSWFDNGKPPPWAVEVQRFSVPDNHIAGDSEISVYQLRWDLYKPLTP